MADYKEALENRALLFWLESIQGLISTSDIDA
jgi:hypothetical protein